MMTLTYMGLATTIVDNAKKANLKLVRMVLLWKYTHHSTSVMINGTTYLIMSLNDLDVNVLNINVIVSTNRHLLKSALFLQQYHLL